MFRYHLAWVRSLNPHPWHSVFDMQIIRENIGWSQVKEIIYPLGATIDVRQIKLGDETMSVLEIWGAEYQENDALLIKPEARDLLEAVCARERCNLQVNICPPLPPPIPFPLPTFSPLPPPTHTPSNPILCADAGKTVWGRGMD
jgi:hypothetical protein